MLWFRKHKTNRTTRRVVRARPVIEQLETREVPAGLFVQGRAYIDANNDGSFDAGDTTLAGAQVSLFSASDLSTPLQTQTVGSDGMYLFTGLAAGNYRLVETPASGYINRAANADNWGLGGAVATQPNIIDVTISSTPYTLSYNGEGANLPVFMDLLNNPNVVTSGTRFGEFPGVLSVTLSGGALSTPTTYNTFCLNLGFPIETAGVTPTTSFIPSNLPGAAQADRIAFLYNKYANSFNSSDPTTNAVNAAALQIALWELVYDNDPSADPSSAGYLSGGNANSGNYFMESVLPGAPGNLTPDPVLTAKVKAQAYAYLAESVGKSAPVIFLDGPDNNIQLTMINGSLDFGNIVGASISGTKSTDVTGNGFSSDDTKLAGVTINLYKDADADGKLTSADGAAIATAITGSDGSYSFTNLAPGTYFVQEAVPAGSIQTAGGPTLDANGNSYYTFNTANGSNATGLNFDDFQLGSISGTKWLDLTGDGFSDDDVELAGVTINLYATQLIDGSIVAVGDPIATTTTDDQGNYSFAGLKAGTYFVQEVTPAGYTETGGQAGYYVTVNSGTVSTNNNFDNFRPGAISGYKYNDLNGDGLINDGTNPVVAGVTINLYGTQLIDGSLIAVGDPIATTTTNSNGFYSFTNLAAGTYFVQEVVQSGWIETVGNSGYYFTVDPTLIGDPNSANNNFANFQLITVSGTKFTDITGNGFSSDDTALGGVTINLYQDANSDGILTSADGDPIATTTTASDGSYSFSNLGPGTYFIQEVVPAGYIQTAGPAADVNGNRYYTLTATSGVNAGNGNFDNFQTVTLSGTKYKDLTGNGITSDDVGLGGITINLYLGTSATGTPIATTTTAADGSYSFAGLTSGTYFVQETVPAGSTETVGQSGYVVTVGSDTVPSGSNVKNLNFANYTAGGSISGTKFLDITGNGYSSDDTGFGGVTIYLDANNNSRLDSGEKSTVTASDGTYSFTGLAAGTYIVREVVPTGFIRTGPTLQDYYSVTITAGGAGSVSTGNNFDNAEECEPNTVTCVSFCIYHACGTHEVVTDLRGHTQEGDTIVVTFNVNVPQGETHPVTFVSYTAPQPYFDDNASQQQIYDIATGEFGPGTHTLTIHVPNCYYQVDFVCGYAIDKLGPAGSNIFYTPQERLISADNGGTHACCTGGMGGTGSISGYKFNDTNANGVWNTGESAIKGITVFLDTNNNGRLDSGEQSTVTDSNGFYKFSNLAAGTYRVREVVPTGWIQSAGPAGSDTLTLTSGQNKTGVNFGDYTAATISGYKFNDKNGDGVWDKNGQDNRSGTSDDEVGLSGWQIFVDYNNNGKYDAGEATDVTDANGYYSISGVKAGTYNVLEVQQSGWIRTTDTDCVTLKSGSCVSNVNIGNMKADMVMSGDTATIGFWANKNGQCLINSLNGRSTSKALGNWLADNFGNMFGNLRGDTNSQVASYFVSLFKQSGQKLGAQVLATALAVYVTDSDLAGGNYASGYGFTVNHSGLGDNLYNIGNNGAAFGAANNSLLSVTQILQYTNSQYTWKGFWNGSSSLQNMGNVVYSGINQQGDIS